jgi:predicted nucleic acid-binding protein
LACSKYFWRSEFRGALVGHIRAGELTSAQAHGAYERATAVIGGREHLISTAHLLDLSEGNRITAYDLEFVLLARELGVQLVTFDKEVLTEFPAVAVHPNAFLSR